VKKRNWPTYVIHVLESVIKNLDKRKTKKKIEISNTQIEVKLRIVQEKMGVVVGGNRFLRKKSRWGFFTRREKKKENSGRGPGDPS